MRSSGDRRAARAANERVVELLRPRAQTDMATYGSQLLDALEELSELAFGAAMSGVRGLRPRKPRPWREASAAEAVSLRRAENLAQRLTL